MISKFSGLSLKWLQCCNLFHQLFPLTHRAKQQHVKTHAFEFSAHFGFFDYRVKNLTLYLPLVYHLEDILLSSWSRVPTVSQFILCTLSSIKSVSETPKAQNINLEGNKMIKDEPMWIKHSLSLEEAQTCRMWPKGKPTAPALLSWEQNKILGGSLQDPRQNHAVIT